MEAVKGIFGGGNAAQKEAKRSREIQAVANDRQLAALNREDSATKASRRQPRGFRLFEDGPAGADVALT